MWNVRGLRSTVNAGAGSERRPGHPLGDDLGVLVYEDAHLCACYKRKRFTAPRMTEAINDTSPLLREINVSIAIGRPTL